MTTLNETTRHVPEFRTGSRLTVVRDVAMLGACIALIAGFIAHAWTLPTPAQLRSAASPATLRIPA